MNATEMRLDKEIKEESKEVKRIASLDFLRGLAIFFVVFIHSFHYMYDHTWLLEDPSKILDFPIPFLIIAGILGYFALWVGFFILLSSIVNSYIMTKKASTIDQKRKIVFKQLLTGFAIITLGYIRDAFFYWGYFGQVIKSGYWTNLYPLWSSLFEMKPLQIIGWCLVINGVIHYLLMLKDGHEKYLRNLIIYGSLAVIIITSTPFLHNWVGQMDWIVPDVDSIPITAENRAFTGWPNHHVATANASFKTWILAILTIENEPIFPFLATSMIGSMIGISLAKPKPPKRFPLKAGLASIFLLGLGVILVVSGVRFTFVEKPPAIPTYLIDLGGEVGLVTLCLWLFEFRGKATKFANNRIVKHFRLWGMVSLSIFCLDLYVFAPRAFLQLIVGRFTSFNFMHDDIFVGIEGLAWVLLVSFVVIAFYELLLWLWKRINFTCSFEWFMIRLQSLLTKKKSIRLNVDFMMNKVHWINFELIK